MQPRIRAEEAHMCALGRPPRRTEDHENHPAVSPCGGHRGALQNKAIIRSAKANSCSRRSWAGKLLRVPGGDVHCFGNPVPPGLSRSVGAAATSSHAKRCRGSGSAHHSHREAKGLSASSHRHLSSNVDIWNSIFVNSEGRMDLVSSEAPLRRVLSWFSHAGRSLVAAMGNPY